MSVVPPASAPHPRPPGRVGDRSPLWWPAAVASGILACLAGAVAAACAALALCGLAFAVRRSARTLAVVALLAAAGAVSAAGRLTASNSEVLPHLARARADVVLESVVVSDPEPTRYGWKTLLSVRSVGTDTGKWTVRERVVLFESSRGVGLEPGDRVWVRGKLKTPLELGPAERLAGRPATALSGEEVVRVGKASNPMMAWANRVHSTAAILAGQALPREEAALVRGVAFGDTSGISEETVEDFRASGLSHLLAVSGQNLGVFLAVVLPLAALLGLGPRGRAAAGLTAVAFFVALTRWEPSVLRAAAMGAVGLAALAAGRTRDTVRALGLGGVVLLLADPGLEFSRGFQLSFAATMGIVFVSPRVLARVPARCPRILAQALAVSLGAQIAVAPVLMLTNGTFGLAGIPANVIGLPLAGPAMLLGVTGAFAGVAWAPLGRMLFALDRPVLDALLGLAHTFARAPGARVPAQGWWAVALPAVFALVCLRSAGRLGRRLSGYPRFRRGIRVLLVLALCACPLVAGRSRHELPPGPLALFLSVGEGDSTLLRSASGTTVLVDGGPDRDLVSTKLAEYGIRKVDLLVVTHPHEDHLGGLAGVVSKMRVGAVWQASTSGNHSSAGCLGTALRKRGVASAVPDEGRFRIGDLTVDVISSVRPEPADLASAGAGSKASVAEVVGESDESGVRLNNSSIVLVAQMGGLRVLLSGDIEQESQGELLARVPDSLASTVLKVPHHGSPRVLPAFLKTVAPKVAVVSVGPNNFGHPSPRTMTGLATIGSRVFRTDRDGDVLVRATANGVEARSFGRDRRAARPPRPPVACPNPGPVTIAGYPAGRGMENPGGRRGTALRLRDRGRRGVPGEPGTRGHPGARL